MADRRPAQVTAAQSQERRPQNARAAQLMPFASSSGQSPRIARDGCVMKELAYCDA
jgi:hypothetical protein